MNAVAAVARPLFAHFRNAWHINANDIIKRDFGVSKPTSLESKFLLMAWPVGTAALLAFNAQNNGVPWLIGALLGGFFGVAIMAAFTFIGYAIDVIFVFCSVLLLFLILPLAGLVDFISGNDIPLLLAIGCIIYLLLFSWLPFAVFLSVLKTISVDKDRQAHLLFLLSMAALGWALWLQSGGHWQQMAVLDSPIVVPLLNWKIPLTDNLGFLFALLGFVHDPVAGSLSVASQVPISALTLFVAAGLLFLFAEIRLHKSEVGIQPRFALLAFVLFWAAVFLDVALHWSGAPVLLPELILFNRAFAVLAFAVYLFWRRVAKNGEPVRGADGVFKRACDWAEVEGWKIAAWLLGVLWLATELSYLWPSGFPEQVKYLLCVALLAVPVRKIIGFKHEFDSYLSAYRNAQQLERESYQPPPVIATADETRRALGDD